MGRAATAEAVVAFPFKGPLQGSSRRGSKMGLDQAAALSHDEVDHMFLFPLRGMGWPGSGS